MQQKRTNAPSQRTQIVKSLTTEDESNVNDANIDTSTSTTPAFEQLDVSSRMLQEAIQRELTESPKHLQSNSIEKSRNQISIQELFISETTAKKSLCAFCGKEISGFAFAVLNCKLHVYHTSCSNNIMNTGLVNCMLCAPPSKIKFCYNGRINSRFLEDQFLHSAADLGNDENQRVSAETRASLFDTISSFHSQYCLTGIRAYLTAQGAQREAQAEVLQTHIKNNFSYLELNNTKRQNFVDENHGTKAIINFAASSLNFVSELLDLNQKEQEIYDQQQKHFGNPLVFIEDLNTKVLDLKNKGITPSVCLENKIDVESFFKGGKKIEDLAALGFTLNDLLEMNFNHKTWITFRKMIVVDQLMLYYGSRINFVFLFTKICGKNWSNFFKLKLTANELMQLGGADSHSIATKLYSCGFRGNHFVKMSETSELTMQIWIEQFKLTKDLIRAMGILSSDIKKVIDIDKFVIREDVVCKMLSVSSLEFFDTEKK